ncbi:DUF547 domain-containing protein [Pseudoalteromonas shioyasakiensis]|uniref:DUF547 domain-containing protein n=1 Tax=Pseudoalteromonas shioyasakiensis TaxID=1190813 RepID=UPI0021195358|nr:DUF547 domain-containing protein [Pseudoalteromonas shioyasakiensis]MCQ8883387.1 DUF547 domain-containing protein [Pseudoalteromonas shioyasakiensis]
MKNAIKPIVLATSLILVTACNSTAPINKTATTAINQEKFSQFHQYDEKSNITLEYTDYGQILNASVIDLGMSDRYRISNNTSKIGTRLSSNPKPSTATEANRFYYDSYKKNPQMKQDLQIVQENMADLPNKINLSNLPKSELLAYWLNLYNVTVLNELVQQYPVKNLTKLLNEEPNFFDKPRFNFNGNQYSLNDIEYNIVAPLFNNDPLLIYGYYRGYIGSPNLLDHPYTAKNVFTALTTNAVQFVNSNRGSVIGNHNTRVSSLYLEKKNYFPNFEEDLADHLQSLVIQEPDKDQVVQNFSFSIDNYDITDILGSDVEYGGGNATVADPSIVAEGFDTNFVTYGENLTKEVGHVSPLRREILQKITQKYYEANTRVEIKDLPAKESEDK